MEKYARLWLFEGLILWLNKKGIPSRTPEGPEVHELFSSNVITPKQRLLSPHVTKYTLNPLTLKQVATITFIYEISSKSSQKEIS